MPTENPEPDELEQDHEPELTPAPAAGEFFENPGPEWNPDAVPEPEPERDLDPENIGWTPDGVANVLRDVQAPAFNALLNPLLGVTETDWSHREKRLQQVAPAIAREWNRIPHMKAMAGQTDRAVILSYFLLEYFPPRVFDVMEERKQRRAQETEERERDLDEGQVQVEVRPAPERPAEQPARPTGLPPRRRS